MSSGGATNWKTNVNRAKTKRWVEAKSYTYDGDDWGEADEYGEYDGGYDDEPEPPPKPTGLRQAGKGAAGMSNVPPQQVQPFPPQQIQDTRPLGQPEPPFQQSDRQRTNSFGRGDDRRGFSGPSNPSFTQPLVDRGRATPFPTPNRPRAPSDAHGMQQQAQPSFEQAPSTSGQGIPNRAPWSDSSRSQSMTSSSAANPQQLEFSYPSAAPQPLQARPPRKSSLSQSDRGQPGSIAPPQTNMPLGGSQTHGTSQQNVSTPTIIRPADIYARMKGKKERERLSQESSRPSMDSIQAPEPSPANASDNERKQKKQGLESVAERKSEHGIEGLLVATNTKPSIKPAGPKDSLVLPEIGGFEGFGQGFGDSFMSLPGDTEAGEGRTESLSVSGGAEVKAGPAKIEPVSQTPIEFDTIPEALAKPSQPTRAEPAEPDSKITNPSPNSSLHHEPSLGFRSAVNQAFDSQIPPTPSSASGSNLDRSNSESTNDISPIISRNTSGAVAPPKKDIPSITSIPEEPPTTPRPGIAVASWAVVGERTASRESLQALKQGHRRNISTPSPDNSPARTPNVEVNRQLQSPQEAELETITPTTASYNTNSTSNRVAHEEPNSPSRAGSPTKGRVRDLVDKLDSASNSRKGSESSLREKADVSQRPNLDTQQSFRPQLPGAWPSYLSNVPGQQPKHESETTTPGANDPFAAAAAARTALAGALATAVGFMPEPNDNDGQPTAKLEEPRSIPTKGSAMRPEAQRLPLPRSESDAPSSIVPTPTYMKSETSDREGNEEYFAPITPLNQRAKQGNLKDLPQLEKTRAYDDMSTESSPNDLESDRLRKELVRELSPQVESFNQVSESPVHNQDSPSQARAHESMFLPSEYESYWNAAPEGGESSRKASELGSLPAGSPPVQKSQFQPAQNTSHPMQPHPQPLHQRQFSGNQGHQAVPNEVQSRKDQPEDASSYSSQTGETLMPQQPRRMSHKFSWEGPAEATSQNNPSQASDTAANNLRNEITAESPLPRPPVAVAHEHTPSSSSMPDLNKQLPQGPAESAYDVPGQRDSFRSEYPAFVEPSQETVPSETPPQSSQQAKIPAFREIMAIKDVDERLRTYDATRTQFANMNTGLADWIQATISTLPEHSDLIRNGGCFGPNARPIQASSNPNSGSQRPLQSQVLKSSFPPGAGKTTSQKGKDLIHTAGVFGGKAGSATKGFFSKGRSKLRGLGGDKAPKKSRKPSDSASNTPPIGADSSSPWSPETSTLPIPTHQVPTSHIPPTPQSFTEPSVIESPPSPDLACPIPPPFDQVDSPITGEENRERSEIPRASDAAPDSPISAEASFENGRALQQKRASHTNKRASVSAYGPSASDFQSRLTVHEKQMMPFQDSFPPDLIIPAEFRNLPAYPNDPKRNATEEETPTQADYPPRTFDDSGCRDNPLSNGLEKNAHLEPYDVPASTDHAIDPERTPAEQLLDVGEAHGGRGNRASSLSFIQFTDMQAEGLALQAPVTPHRLRHIRESRSTFDKTAFDSPERDLDQVVSVESDEQATMRQSSRSMSASSQMRDRQSRSASTKSSLRRTSTRDTPKYDVEQLDSPTIPADTFRVMKQQDHKKQPSISLFPNTTGRSASQPLVAARPSLFPMQQNAPLTPSTAVSTPQATASKKKQRSSLLGNLGIKGLESSTRSHPSLHKRAGTDMQSYSSDFAADRKTSSPQPITEPPRENLQRAATVTPNSLGEKKKARFLGLSSFINKAGPRRQRSSPEKNHFTSPEPFEKPIFKSTLEQSHRVVPLQQAVQQKAYSPDSSSTQEPVPQGRGPIQNAVISHKRIESDAGQADNDYKSVFPPEFYARDPVEGYYGASQAPVRFSQQHDHGPEPSTTANRSLQSSIPLAAYAVAMAPRKRDSISTQFLEPFPNRSPSATHDILFETTTPPSPERDSISAQFQKQSHNRSASAPLDLSLETTKPPSPRRQTIRSIDSNLFDIETPPPPPPKDKRYSSTKRPTSGPQRGKRQSTVPTKVTFSSLPITTTTTTTTTQHKRLSSPSQPSRLKQDGSSSSQGLQQSVSSTSSPKPSRSSYRQSLPPLKTQNLVGQQLKSPRESLSAAPKLTDSAMSSSPQNTTTHAPTITSTMTVTSSSPQKSAIPASSQAPQPRVSAIEDTTPQPIVVADASLGGGGRPAPTAATMPRHMSPVEKMKDEPRETSQGTVRHEAGADESDDEIVMSSTAYPGQEWRPDFGYGGWEGD